MCRGLAMGVSLLSKWLVIIVCAVWEKDLRARERDRLDRL